MTLTRDTSVSTVPSKPTSSVSDSKPRRRFSPLTAHDAVVWTFISAGAGLAATSSLGPPLCWLGLAAGGVSGLLATSAIMAATDD